MFNLPFPTDSLYKFSFIFGLALIVFSIYYEDKELNHFDRKQTYLILDSLKNTNTLLRDFKHFDSLYFVNVEKDPKDNLYDRNRISKEFFNHMKELRVLNKTKFLGKLFNIDTSLDNQLKLLLADSLIIKDSPQKEPLLKKVEGEIEFRISIAISANQEDVDFFTNKYNKDKLSDIFLMVTGILLFGFGSVLWYLKIQKPQDRLLVMQLEQVEKQNIKLNTEFLDWEKKQIQKPGRKHHDPINIKKKKV